jgi:hypothetical protein
MILHMTPRHDPACTPIPRAGRRRLRAILFGVLFALAADQVVRLTLLRGDFLFGVRVAPFDPPLFSPLQFEAIARIRREIVAGPDTTRVVMFDPELGWTHRPLAHQGPERIDGSGARLSPRPEPPSLGQTAPRRIAAFGCSFVHGTEVGDGDAWPHRVTMESNGTIDVRNFGVPGYGLDQSFLRWRQLADGLAVDDVWLGFMPEAAARNVNCYRPALRPWSPTVAFKPRFLVDERGDLQLIPSPCRSLTELVDLVDDSALFLERVGPRDAFVGRIPSAFAPHGSHWSHWSATTRLLLTLVARARPDAHALLAEPDGEVARTTRAIGRAMDREVRARGARFAVVVLPDREGLRIRRHEGRATWQAVVDAWRDAGITVHDLSDHLDAEDATQWARGGHYSPRGNALVAAAIASRLRT